MQKIQNQKYVSGIFMKGVLTTFQRDRTHSPGLSLFRQKDRAIRVRFARVFNRFLPRRRAEKKLMMKQLEAMKDAIEMLASEKEKPPAAYPVTRSQSKEDMKERITLLEQQLLEQNSAVIQQTKLIESTFSFLLSTDTEDDEEPQENFQGSYKVCCGGTVWQVSGYTFISFVDLIWRFISCHHCLNSTSADAEVEDDYVYNELDNLDKNRESVTPPVSPAESDNDDSEDEGTYVRMVDHGIAQEEGTVAVPELTLKKEMMAVPECILKKETVAVPECTLEEESVFIPPKCILKKETVAVPELVLKKETVAVPELNLEEETVAVPKSSLKKEMAAVEPILNDLVQFRKSRTVG
jgi:hypothetical protein